MIDDTSKETALKRKYVDDHNFWGVDFGDIHVYGSNKLKRDECAFEVSIGWSGLRKSFYRAIPDTKQDYGFKIEEITLLGELGRFFKGLVSH